MLVAILLVTITFAAAFTLPGGFNSAEGGAVVFNCTSSARGFNSAGGGARGFTSTSTTEESSTDIDDGNSDSSSDEDKSDPNRSAPDGSAVLIKKISLKVFVLSDTVAVCSSMSVVFLLILAVVGDPVFLRSAIIYSKNLLYLALGATMIAFVSGLYAVIEPGSKVLAFIVCIIGSSVPFLILYLRRKSSTSSPRVLTSLMKRTMSTMPTCLTPAGIKAENFKHHLSAFKASRTPLIKGKPPTPLKISSHKHFSQQ